jgi:hypothetical protein
MSRFDEFAIRNDSSLARFVLDRLVVRKAFDSLMSSPQILTLRKAGKLAYVDPFISLCDVNAGHCRTMSNTNEPLYSDFSYLTVE